MSLVRVLAALLTINIALTSIVAAQQRPQPPSSSAWTPNRGPNFRPPASSLRPPTWANAPRPGWARNNGHRRGTVLVNPRPFGPSWGWNRGRPWTANPGFWGGGFWGAFAAFTVAGALWNQTRFTSPSVGSPGWTLFQNYGLQPARCGPQNLVYIYGPNNSVMCAFPNRYVPAGFYWVDPATLQLFVM
jgi:hypothetical protein